MQCRAAFLVIIHVAGAAGCALPPPRESETLRQLRQQLREAREEGARAPERDTAVALRINRNLLYKPKWSRAEDLAETLQPIVESLYGPTALVVAHDASNTLFVYVPDAREREFGRQGAAASPNSGSSAQRSPTPSNASPRRGRMRSTTSRPRRTLGR